MGELKAATELILRTVHIEVSYFQIFPCVGRYPSSSGNTWIRNQEEQETQLKTEQNFENWRAACDNYI